MPSVLLQRLSEKSGARGVRIICFNSLVYTACGDESREVAFFGVLPSLKYAQSFFPILFLEGTNNRLTEGVYYNQKTIYLI